MKKLYLSISAFVLAIALLAGAAFYYASAQDPTTTTEQPRPIQGSVRAPSPASIWASLAKIDILKAIDIAKGQQSGTVIAAHLAARNSYVVYEVVMLAADDSSVLVTIDAGNGNVLGVTKLPPRRMGGRFGHPWPGRQGGE